MINLGSGSIDNVYFGQPLSITYKSLVSSNGTTYYYDGLLYEGMSLYSLPGLTEIATLHKEADSWGNSTLYAISNGSKTLVSMSGGTQTLTNNNVYAIYLGEEKVWGNTNITQPTYRASLFGGYTSGNRIWYATSTKMNADVWLEADMGYYGGGAPTYSSWYLGTKNGAFEYSFTPHGGGGFEVNVGGENIFRVKDKNIHHIVIKPDQGYASVDDIEYHYAPKSNASGTLGAFNLGRNDGSVLYSDLFAFATFKLTVAGVLTHDLLPYIEDDGSKSVYNIAKGSVSTGNYIFI